MKVNHFMLFGAFALITLSCGDNGNGDKETIDAELIDPKSSLNTNFDGKIFSIPSPILTAMLIKNTSKTYFGDILNPSNNADKYNSEFSRALNLGVFGADLGYASLYDQKADAINYLATVEKLTSALGLEGAFDATFMKRYENNLSNKDSMMIVVSDAFKKADLFLKNSNRKSTSSLILTGGWIESMYFACQLSAKSGNTEIVQRIGEQKQTLATIIEILNEYNKMGSNDDLIEQLVDLAKAFDDVKMIYTYAEPETNAEKKITTLKHTTTYEISEATLKSISQKLTAIRTSIIS